MGKIQASGIVENEQSNSTLEMAQPKVIYTTPLPVLIERTGKCVDTVFETQHNTGMEPTRYCARLIPIVRQSERVGRQMLSRRL